MNNAYRKVSRGQVWYLIDNHIPAVHYEGSVQGKNRPWLIVSNNMCNQSSPIYTVVPLTTAAKNNLPVHVDILAEGKNQTILCEQIRTVPQNIFNESGSHYMFTLSESIMKLVDEALAIQLGLQIVFPNSDRYWESLSNLIRVKVKEAVAQSKVSNLDINNVATLLNAQVDKIVQEEVPAREEIKARLAPQPVQSVVENACDNPPTKEKPNSWVPHKKTKSRRKWSTEDMKKFLEDCEKYTSKDLSEKYGMEIKTIYVTKYKFKKILSENV